ncbi:MAG TPA: peroxiredoxin [Candidatus Saccharimonadales bacterium]|nr:peroxiredoxin [Candidatus Saccharimonadales bacterium]
MIKAPNFNLTDQNGNTHSLTDYHGRWLVLYFYPKDDTPGCTTEACSFRDERELISELGKADVVGISKDSVASHKKFADKYGLTFTILSDPEHKVIEAYDSWKPLKFAGREYIGTQRNTFIIDPSGSIAKKYEKVDPKTHAGQIIEDLKALQAEAS